MTDLDETTVVHVCRVCRLGWPCASREPCRLPKVVTCNDCRGLSTGAPT